MSSLTLSVVHLEVHHVYQEGGGHDQNFGIDRKSVIEINHKVIRVSESLPAETHPLLGDPPQLPVLGVHHLELHVPAEVDMTGRAADF